jgi:hypothetical protein
MFDEDTIVETGNRTSAFADLPRELLDQYDDE